MTFSMSTPQGKEHSYLSSMFQSRYNISRIALRQLRDISELLLFFSIVEIGRARLPFEPSLADEGLLVISSRLMPPLRCSEESTRIYQCTGQGRAAVVTYPAAIGPVIILAVAYLSAPFTASARVSADRICLLRWKGEILRA